MRKSPVIAALLGLCALSACSGFESAYIAANKAGSGSANYEELLRLDQRFPDRLKLKIDLGSRLLATGNLTAAKAYLDRGQELLGALSGSRSRYRLFSSLSELKLREGNFQDAAALAAKALTASAADDLGTVFVKAKAQSSLGNHAESIAAFDAGWAKHRDRMIAEDYRAYSLALLAAGRDAEALAVLAEYQKSFSYDPGTGLVESGCYERLGDMGSAILCAFKEYEYRRVRSDLSDESLVSALRAGLKKAANLKPASLKPLETLVKSLECFAKGDWARVIAVPERAFGDYVVLASRLEAGSASAKDIERYLLLEPLMKSFQAYYYHLWRGTRRPIPGGPERSQRSLLEKCIGLAPASPMARESRRELGRITRIGEAAGERLLVPVEIDAIFAELISGAPLAKAEPILSLLATPDNDYQASCVYALGRLAADPAMKAYLTAKAKTATGKLRERLDYILCP